MNKTRLVNVNGYGRDRNFVAYKEKCWKRCSFIQAPWFFRMHLNFLNVVLLRFVQIILKTEQFLISFFLYEGKKTKFLLCKQQKFCPVRNHWHSQVEFCSSMGLFNFQSHYFIIEEQFDLNLTRIVGSKHRSSMAQRRRRW